MGTWWRHQIETFSALLALCVGNSLVNSPHNGQCHGASMFSLICAWTNGWVNDRDAGGLRCLCAHYHVTLMYLTQDMVISCGFGTLQWGCARRLCSSLCYSGVLPDTPLKRPSCITKCFGSSECIPSHVGVNPWHISQVEIWQWFRKKI